MVLEPLAADRSGAGVIAALEQGLAELDEDARPGVGGEDLLVLLEEGAGHVSKGRGEAYHASSSLQVRGDKLPSRDVVGCRALWVAGTRECDFRAGPRLAR